MSDAKEAARINGVYILLAAVIGLIGMLSQPFVKDYVDIRKEKRQNNHEEKYKSKIDKNQYEKFKDNILNIGDTGSFFHKGTVYTWSIMKDGQKWITKNINIEIRDSWCYDRSSSMCEIFGRLYTKEAAWRACKELGNGWKLPTATQWEKLARTYGGYVDSEIEIRVGEPRVSYQQLSKGGKSGFHAPMSGMSRYSGTESLLLGHDGYYWSSTDQDDDNAWHFNFDGADQTLEMSIGNKVLGFSCRCIHD